jgi:hypothetical protein
MFTDFDYRYRRFLGVLSTGDRGSRTRYTKMFLWMIDLMAFVLPISLYIGWFFVVKNIISRP